MQLNRAFLAISLDEESKKNIFNRLSFLRKEYPFFHWVVAENYHITLYFHGYVKDFNRLNKRIEEVIYSYSPFYIYSRNLGIFINSKILLYLGFRKQKQMEKISFKLNSIFHPEVKQKKFIPHLTLARYKIPSKQQYFTLKKKIRKIDLDFEFKVSYLTLFESVRLQTGPIYKEVKRYKLENF